MNENVPFTFMLDDGRATERAVRMIDDVVQLDEHRKLFRVGGETLPVDRAADVLRALHGTHGALDHVWLLAKAARARGDHDAVRLYSDLLDAIAVP
jgi:hypothetical protein